MTLVDDDEVKKVLRIFAIETGAAFVLGDGLVGREVHLAAFDGLAFDLVARVAERLEGLGHRLVHQDVAVGKKEDAGLARLARSVPAGVPKLPAMVRRCTPSLLRSNELSSWSWSRG